MALTLNLTPAECRRIKAFAAREGVSMTELVRWALRCDLSDSVLPQVDPFEPWRAT